MSSSKQEEEEPAIAAATNKAWRAERLATTKKRRRHQRRWRLTSTAPRYQMASVPQRAWITLSDFPDTMPVRMWLRDHLDDDVLRRLDSYFVCRKLADKAKSRDVTTILVDRLALVDAIYDEPRVEGTDVDATWPLELTWEVLSSHLVTIAFRVEASYAGASNGFVDPTISEKPMWVRGWSQLPPAAKTIMEVVLNMCQRWCYEFSTTIQAQRRERRQWKDSDDAKAIWSVLQNLQETHLDM